jgi:hypothetical protein
MPPIRAIPQSKRLVLIFHLIHQICAFKRAPFPLLRLQTICRIRFRCSDIWPQNLSIEIIADVYSDGAL